MPRLVVGSPARDPAALGGYEHREHMSKQSLLTLRSDFETGARCFHDLRCLWSQCTRLQYHRVEPILDKLAAPLMGGRPETHSFYGNVASDEQETEWIFRFYGDRDGAHRFWEMATGAGGYLDANAISLLPRRRKRWLMGVEEGAFYWMRAIFTVAWDWKNRPGLALRADKIKFPGPHGVHYFSILRINPFTASVMLIDVLSDVGSRGKPTHADDGDGGSPVDTEPPRWDDNLRELRLRGQRCKQFRQPAKNQVTILRTFQDDDWPGRIDDPLPGVHGKDLKRRLRETVRSLNVNMHLLHFECDGTGEGVIWNQAP